MLGRTGAVAAGLAAVTAVALPSPATAQLSTISSARGEASGVFVRVADPALFLEDTILEPPVVNLSYARAELDRTGAGAALASTGYSEYLNLLGAVPELGPAFLPPEALPVFELLIEYMPPGLAEDVANLTQASVRGAPEQHKDATYFPDNAVEGGVMRASITEGPVAQAQATYVDAPLSLLLDVASMDSTTTITQAGTGRRADVITVLRDVTIAQILEIDQIRVTAVATADGANGIAEGSVTIDGVTVAGLPAIIDQDGLRLTDQVLPLSVGPLNQVLESAGITITAPGKVTAEPGGELSSVEAIGPTLTVVTPEGQEVTVTLGRSVASSDLAIIGASAAPPANPPATSSPGSTGTDVGTSTTPPTSSGTFTTPSPTLTTPTAPAAGSNQPLAPSVPEVAPTETAVYALDQERLILASDEARRGIEDIYGMLMIPMLIIGALGVARPWRTD